MPLDFLVANHPLVKVGQNQIDQELRFRARDEHLGSAEYAVAPKRRLPGDVLQRLAIGAALYPRTHNRSLFGGKRPVEMRVQIDALQACRGT